MQYKPLLALALCGALSGCGEGASEPETQAAPAARVQHNGDVVFARSETTKGARRWRLWRVRADGGAPRLFHERLFPADDVAVSPDGRWIAYTRPGRTGGTTFAPLDVFVSSTAGGEAKRLTRSRTSERAPRWSPDGRFLRVADVTRETSHVYVVETDAGYDQWEITSHPGIETGGSWSPDARRLLYSHGDMFRPLDLYWTDVGSGEVRRLTETADLDEVGTWGPADEIAYTVRPHVEPRGELYVARADGRERRLLARTDSALPGPPVWSPDGTRIAWPLYFRREAHDARDRIGVLPASGAARTIAAADAFAGSTPVWAPDGRALAFVRVDARGAGDVWVADANGRNARRLTRSRAAERLVAWLLAENL